MRFTLNSLLVLLVAFFAIGVAAPASHAVAPQEGGAKRVIEMQVKAKGPTALVALRRAIADAARQVNEPTLAADPSRRPRFEDSLRDLDSALSAGDMTVERAAAEIRTLSGGLADRVVVLDSREAAGEFEVAALVGIATFEARLASRKSIAVMDLRPASGNFSFAGSPVSGKEISRTLADKTTERLVQTGILTVLDRQHIDEVAKERNFVELYGRTPEELARFGKMLGADLLLVGSIETAGLEVNVQEVQASGYTFSRAFAGMSVAVRLLDVQTGAIAWADTLRVNFNNGELGRMFEGKPDASGTLGLMNDAMALRLAGAVVENVAPIKVALVDGPTVWLNRGLGRVELGMRLQIRGGNQEIFDPDTGESLGLAERTVAVVEVVSVDAKKSQCNVIEGDLVAIRTGYLARPLTPVGGGS